MTTVAILCQCPYCSEANVYYVPVGSGTIRVVCRGCYKGFVADASKRNDE